MTKQELIKKALKTGNTGRTLRKIAIQKCLDNLSGITFKEWTGRNIHRVYANNEHGQSIGYFESREQNRGADSSYDRHRIVKGDINVHSDAILVSENQEMKDLFDSLKFKNLDGSERSDIMIIAQNLIMGNVGH